MVEVKITRRIPASVETVYRAWTDPAQIAKWQGGRLIAEIAVDGLWFWEHSSDSGAKVPHYGRYIALDENARIVTTWVSPGTHGNESRLEITLAEKEGQTELVLHHTSLPDDAGGRGHEGGWTYFVDRIAEVVTK
ncbi:MAG TPA: SRPBCC domain-containing protein [Polyangiaceae bacterium]|jgi:uncharacterized protein YndB with AHSA1/START domain|nr:SRPBCC domain-containing protein [Polyangiaceae bacterium]